MGRNNLSLPAELIENFLENGPTIVAMANEKGGVGKTSLSFLFGTALAKEGVRVLFVDMDPQGDLTSSLSDHARVWNEDLQDDTIRSNSFQNASVMKVFDAESVAPVIVNTNIFSLTATKNLSRLTKYEAHETARLADWLITNKQQFDIAIIDCPPTRGTNTVAALGAATDVFIPAAPSQYSYDGANNMIESIGNVRSLNSDIRLAGILLNSTKKQPTKIQSEFIEAFANTWPVHLMKSRIRHLSGLEESVTLGHAIEDYARTSPIAADLYDFWVEALERLTYDFENDTLKESSHG